MKGEHFYLLNRHKGLRCNDEGFGLLDIMAVIVITAVIAIGVMSFIEISQGRVRVNNAFSQAKEIHSAVRSWAPRPGDYRNVSLEALISGGYYAPPRDVNGDIYAIGEMNPWLGSINVAHPGSADLSVYTMTFSGILVVDEAEMLAKRLERVGTNITVNYYPGSNSVSVLMGDRLNN